MEVGRERNARRMTKQEEIKDQRTYPKNSSRKKSRRRRKKTIEKYKERSERVEMK